MNVQKWAETAKQKIYVKQMGNTYYALGSELAMLRLFHEHNRLERDRTSFYGYSDKMGQFFFAKELDA